MQQLTENTDGWTRIAKDLTEDEATNYAQIVRTQQIYNQRKDAKYIKAFIEDGKWSVYVTSDFNALSDNEIRRYQNRGESFL